MYKGEENIGTVRKREGRGGARVGKGKSSRRGRRRKGERKGEKERRKEVQERKEWKEKQAEIQGGREGGGKVRRTEGGREKSVLPFPDCRRITVCGLLDHLANKADMSPLTTSAMYDVTTDSAFHSRVTSVTLGEGD